MWVNLKTKGPPIPGKNGSFPDIMTLCDGVSNDNVLFLFSLISESCLILRLKNTKKYKLK